MTTTLKWLPGFLLAVLTLSLRLNAQMPGMRRYTQLDGFSATVGYSLNQDKKGYLWMGTDNGGLSFDGKNFRSVLRNYRIPDTDILDCYPLGKNRVLLIPLTQKVCYFDSDTLVTFEKNSLLKDISSPVHNISASDPVTGAYWLWMNDFPDIMYRFLGRNIKRYAISSKGFYFSAIINDLLIGNMDDGSGRQMPCVYDPSKNSYRYFHDKNGQIIHWNELFIRGSNTNYLLARADRGKGKSVRIYGYSTDNMSLSLVKKIKLPREDHSRPRIGIDRFNDIWLSFIGRRGLYYYGNVNKKDKVYYFRELAAINTSFVDHNGNLWFSSARNSLYFISKNHFRNILLTDRFPLKKEIPKSLSGDGQGGMCVSYANSSEFVYIKDRNYRIIKLNGLFIEGSRNILPAKNNSFILFDMGIALYNITANAITYISVDGNFKDICFFGDNDLLAADNQGVKYIASFAKKDRIFKTIFHKRSTSVEMLNNGSILIGTPKGLYIKRGLEDSARQIGYSLLNESNITEIQRLPGNKALIGTNAFGLFFYSSDGTIKKVGPDTLKSVRSIYRQNDSTYWVSTSDGAFVFRFNKDWSITSGKIYTFYDGLPSNSVNNVYVHQDTAYMATSEGLGVVPLKDDTLFMMSPPGIYINLLQAGQKKFFQSDSSISVLPEQNNIYISLSAISYESLGNVHYYYRLYPLQNQWIHTSEPDIRFTQLPPGDYEFQAFARNAKGNRSRETIVMKICVTPSLWQTIYFKLALTFLTLMTVFFLSRWTILERHKKKIERVRQKKKLAELELEAIKAQINPHFIHNCLNSIQYLNYQSQHERAQEYLSLFARMIRMTMKYSRQAFITLNEEIDYLSNYLTLEKLRFKDKLQYQFDLEKVSNKELLLPAMLIQPYVENALKHATPPKGIAQKIRIQFEVEQETLSVTIADNGPGFPAGEQAGNLGLRLSASRASSYNELFGLNISIERYNKQNHNPDEQGAVIHIKIPKFKNGNII